MWTQSALRLKSCFVLSLAIPALLSLPAFCTLGQNVSSIAGDQAHLKASSRVSVGTSYSVHEMSTPQGTRVRQFVSPGGTVFAVSWRGAAPNLQQLLGSYFEEYVAAASERRAVRGRGLHIETGDLVVETGGHMRFVVGRAFLRSKLPQGVVSDHIR
jgi:predicted thioesterase